MKNENKTYLWSFVLALLATGCQTNRADAPNAILEHQRKIDELENTIIRIDFLMSDAERGLSEIESRSADITDEIDGIIREFDSYKSRVDRLLLEYNAIRNTAKSGNRENANTGDNLWSNDAD